MKNQYDLFVLIAYLTTLVVLTLYTVKIVLKYLKLQKQYKNLVQKIKKEQDNSTQKIKAESNS